MRKANKSVYRVDFVQGKEAKEYFWDLLFEKGLTRRQAKEETRKKYGFYTVNVVATTEERAIRKFEKEFVNDECGFCTIEQIVFGGTF